jgi:hypothetical protein
MDHHLCQLGVGTERAARLVQECLAHAMIGMQGFPSLGGQPAPYVMVLPGPPGFANVVAHITVGSGIAQRVRQYLDHRWGGLPMCIPGLVGPMVAHVTYTPLVVATRHACQLAVQYGEADYIPVRARLRLLATHLHLFAGMQLLWLGEASSTGIVSERYSAGYASQASMALIAPHVIVGLAIGGEQVYRAAVDTPVNGTTLRITFRRLPTE